MLLCYITDRHQFPGGESARRTRLLEKIAEAARCAIDFVQLREKDLSTRDLEELAREAVQAVRRTDRAGALAANRTRLLINSRSDVAIAAGADGVHLRADDIRASEARVIFSKAGVARPVIGVSCHTPAEVALAESHAADFTLFAPVFDKLGKPGIGLEALRAACQQLPGPGRVEVTSTPIAMPVLALGGVTLENTRACIAAGAAGIAAIRLFQENDIAQVVKALR